MEEWFTGTYVIEFSAALAHIEIIHYEGSSLMLSLDGDEATAIINSLNDPALADDEIDGYIEKLLAARAA
jgi:hypothetical protein